MRTIKKKKKKKNKEKKSKRGGRRRRRRIKRKGKRKCIPANVKQRIHYQSYKVIKLS